MPTYAHTTRAAGTVLAGGASGNYNTDHANHITNQTPQQTEDYSTDATQARVKSDGYAAGTDVLATDLSGELEHLRYEVAVLKDYLNGHSPNGATTNAVVPTSPTTVANTLYYDKLKNPMLRTIGARLYKATGFSHPSTGVASVVTMDTERYDMDGAAVGFSAAGAIITIPAGCAGIYHIGADVGFPAHATGTTRAAHLVLNGTTYIASQSVGDFDPTGATALQLNLSCDYKLAVGDTVALWVNQDSGAAMTVTGPNAAGGPEMWLHLIGYST